MRFVRLLLALSVLPPILSAQEPVFKFAVDVDLVELHVTVLDGMDRPVGGLKQENFKIFENRIEQKISVFKHEDIPLSLGLVVDNSRSIEPRKQRLDAAALSFVRKSNPDDETFIVHFDDQVRLAQDFTSVIRELESALAGVKPFGQTAIYDAVHLAIDHMAKARHTKKVLLLITDGVDNTSKRTLEETIDLVKRNRVGIYVVGLLSVSGGLPAEDALIKIAEASGGKAYFPNNVDEARLMIERVARDLREQYTLGYRPTNPNRDGAWRSVRVDVASPPGYPPKLKVNYRHGYFGGTSPAR